MHKAVMVIAETLRRLLWRSRSTTLTLERIEGAIMTLTEQVKDLTDKVGTIEENMSSLAEATSLVGDDIAALKKEIAEANERSNVDLSGLIQRAENIGTAVGAVTTRLREVAGPAAGSDPENPPPPPVEDAGSTGVITGDNE